ncbi:uncharacterized protein MONBRDRAFT_36553, partial [Monosiga brevicollis MX1]
MGMTRNSHTNGSPKTDKEWACFSNPDVPRKVRVKVATVIMVSPQRDQVEADADARKSLDKMEEDEDGRSGGRGADDEDKPSTTLADTAKEPAAPAIDREKTCPLLLRLFCREGGHNHTNDYRGENTPPGELDIYTWMDATLKELSDLIKECNTSARRKGARLAFSSVFKDTRGNPTLRHLGEITNGEETDAGSRSLSDVR